MSSATPLYCYSSLVQGNIRLLRLLPQHDKQGRIQCQLFEYALFDSQGSHPYDALSYVWGSLDKPQSISIDGCCLPITTNLHAALTHLHHRSIERIIWIDAICINQEDKKERSEQVQRMAKIYAGANRVIVWLGEATADTDQALEEIRIAASKQSTGPSDHKVNRQAILTLLQRPWFQRIWVLQEVAAARYVLIKCGYTDIDGYVFCLGLNALQLSYETCPSLQSLIRSATYLIRGAIFRPKSLNRQSGSFSLNISSLGELIEMYHTRRATERHDKVYALLGMSSDDPGAAGLLANYNIPWRQLFRQLVNFSLSKQVSVVTWDDNEIALIKGKGCILGDVSSVEKDITWDDRQSVDITWRKGPQSGKSCRWTLQATVKSILKGDIICLLQGASRPTIIRLHNDYYSIITIAIPTSENPLTDGYTELLSSITFPYDLELIWDWEISTEKSQDWKYYDFILNNQVSNHTKTQLENYRDELARLRNIGPVLRDLERYEEIGENLRKAVSLYSSASKTATNQQFTFSSPYHWGNAEVKNLEIMSDLLLRSGEYTQITEEVTINSLQLLHREVMELLLDRRGSEIRVTKDVVAAIAKDKAHGKEKMMLLLESRWNMIRITELAIVQILQDCDTKVVKRLLDQKGSKVTITENLVLTAAQATKGARAVRLLLNRRGNEVRITENVIITAIEASKDKEVITLLLNQRSHEVRITENVIVTAAKSLEGLSVMETLLNQRGNKVQITENVVVAAAQRFDGVRMLQLLLDRRGNEVQITENVMAAAAQSCKGAEIVKLLLDRRGMEVQITERVLALAVSNSSQGVEVTKLLLDRGGNEIQVTEKVLAAAAENLSQGAEVTKLLLKWKENEVDLERSSPGRS